MMTSLYEYRMLVKGKEVEEQRVWNTTRWLAFHIFWAIPGKKTGAPRSVEKLFPMPWDKAAPKVVCKMTEKEMEAVLGIFEQFKRGHHNE